MDFASWLRSILVVALLGWLLEALQPASDMKRYTRLAIGLLVMVAVMRPLIPVLQTLSQRVADPFLKYQDVGTVLQQGVFLEQGEERLALRNYHEEVDRAAAAAADAVPGISSASAAVTFGSGDAPAGAVVTVSARAPTASLAQEVQQAVAEALGMTAGAVRVDFGKGGG